MPAFAHSARLERGIRAQTYADHVRAVFEGSAERAKRVADHSIRFGAILTSAASHAAVWHDLGKLDPLNQAVLGSISKARLPVNHCDAGVAQLLREVETTGNPARLAAAYLVFAHHIGLPARAKQEAKENLFLRDEKQLKNGKHQCDFTDGMLDALVNLHREAFPISGIESECADWQCALLFRIALSCLVDADHADTAFNYRESPLFDDPPLLPAARLAAIDKYVEGLSKDKTDERNRLRQLVYTACRNADTGPSLFECDSPVGTGKTTAVMAHLLKAACDKKLRRIFVVLPYTNIVTQSVDVYRNSLLLHGENAEQIVVPNHHKAAFSKIDSRQFTALWHAPVIVTTAVQFFETLADNHPSGLRKLHQLPGSAIFIDESHAALPAKLWPRAWNWLKQLTRDWGCHIVLGSGSLNRVWQLKEVDAETPMLPALVEPDANKKTVTAEKNRITPRTKTEPMGLSEFADWMTTIKGPRLVIVNTVQTAAALARHLSRTHGRKKVEHLSTALCSDDRDRTLAEVKARLGRKVADSDWTLIATSCVEAGVDISFRVGFRERSSLTSFLQTSGRVNRGSEFVSSDVWDFQLVIGELVNGNPAVKDSAKILGDLFTKNKVDAESCTEALRREILDQYRADLHPELEKAEKSMDFPTVEKTFRVIDNDTVTAVVKPDLIERLQRHEKVTWQEIQRGSVSLYRKKAEGIYALPKADQSESAYVEYSQFPDLYRWNLDYDGFLGYMAGALVCVENNDPAIATLLCV